MSQTRPLGAQISHMLKDRGVDVIFGIPGVHNQEMYRGIEEAGITHVLARHEQGAGFMADGYARATGKPGVAYVITGPGLCNIMTPMGQAYSDSVPMLVISSCLDETAATKGQLHQMKDQRAAAETVCDWSEEARTAEAAYALIDRALMEFEAKRPRPKHIQVPIGVLQAAAPEYASEAETEPYRTEDDAAAEVVMVHLQDAQSPLFVFGGGVQTGLAPAVAEAAGAATFTTFAARGLMVGHPLNFGASLARPSSAEVLAQADVVIAIGTELAEVDLWRKNLGHNGTLIRIDIDPVVLSDNQRADICIQARADDVLTSLVDMLEGHTPKTRWNAKDIAAQRAYWRAEVDAERPGLVPVCDALRDAVPTDTMIYSDMTQLAYTAKEVWDMDRPGHWHHPTGFGTLGYATPAAIGGAVARKGKPTMAIIGDYGFHYTMQELGVAVELGLPLPIILWDNGKLGEIEDSMVRAQIAPNAVIAHNPDFCKLAEAFGAYAAAPKSLIEMQETVRAAFNADGPTLIYLTPDISTPD
ncbi:5-guanidino-2-oxopentanoate decarboxylase [uncultured Tateyamaria sp.]|uniref:5-guanidino-2-oxopentanoate decarboxylase n=1 Tax=uncultured Tateyamaria sp. TaxID=455651 RepID=UPI002616E78C|nr:5-guanidino-2-oxopentanoate decarboxylase [uncultured Tateyamaria sp.]